jgi:hypothetical protein
MKWILKYQYEENGNVYHKQVQTTTYPNRDDAKEFLMYRIPERIAFSDSFKIKSLEAAE